MKVFLLFLLGAAQGLRFVENNSQFLVEQGSEKQNTLDSIKDSEKDLNLSLNFHKTEDLKPLKTPPMLYADDDEEGVRETQESLAEIHQEQNEVKLVKELNQRQREAIHKAAEEKLL